MGYMGGPRERQAQEKCRLGSFLLVTDDVKKDASTTDECDTGKSFHDDDCQIFLRNVCIRKAISGKTGNDEVHVFSLLVG